MNYIRMRSNNVVLKNKNGFALLLTLFLILFISMLFVALLNLFTTDIHITGNQKNDTQALYIAEAGIEDAIYHLRQDKNWASDGLAPVDFPAGSGNKYTVTYPVNIGIISSVGALKAGYSKTIESKVSVSGTAPPYTVTFIYWEEK